MKRANFYSAAFRSYQFRISAAFLLALILFLAPSQSRALEQMTNANFATNANSWLPDGNKIISTGGYKARDCAWNGAVGDPTGSIRSYIRCARGIAPDGNMTAWCYQQFFVGALASAAYVDVSISDWYQVNVSMASNWSISATGGIYNSADVLIGSLFRNATYSGNNDVALSGPQRPATWTALLPAGDTYRLQLNWTLFSDPSLFGDNNVYHWFDKVVCNISPRGLRVSENAVGQARLDWLASTAPAGNTQIAVTNGYRIYRSTTSGGPWTYVGATGNLFYTHVPPDNDTYYCIEDIDRNGQVSPKSVECLYRRTRLEIDKVSSLNTSVTQGQTGVPVTVTLRNLGASDISFTGASLTFAIPAVGQYTWTRTGPAPGSIIAKNGGTLDVTFSVNVLETSIPDTDTINATASGTNSVTSAVVDDLSADVTHGWLIRSPARLRVLSVTTPSTVYLGQTNVPVDVLVENEGEDNAAALWDSASLKFSLGSYLNIMPQNAFPVTIYAGQATSSRFLLEVDPASIIGTANIDAWINFRDSSLMIPSANNDGALFQGHWTIVAGYVNTYKDAWKIIPKTSFNYGNYKVYARAENLMPLKEHRMRWFDQDNNQVAFSEPAIPTDEAGRFDDELTLTPASKQGTWRVTCTRVFDSTVLAENFFQVGSPASLTLSVNLPDFVSLGQSFIATVTVSNIGSATALDVETATMTILEPASTGGVAFSGGPTPVRQDIAGSFNKTWQLVWQASALGDVWLRCSAFGYDDNATSVPRIEAATQTSNVCTIQTPASLVISSLTENYTSVSRGQEDLIVWVRVTNNGQAGAYLDVATLTYNPAGGHTDMVASPALPVLIPGGGYVDLSYRVDISPTATANTRNITASVRGRDANSGAIVSATGGGPGSWTILGLVGVLSANQAYSPEQYEYNQGQQIYGRFTNGIDNNRYYRVDIYDSYDAATPFITGNYVDGGNKDEVIFDFNTSGAVDKYHTWRVDIHEYTLNMFWYTDKGLVGRLYFENRAASTLSGTLTLVPDPVSIAATVTVTLLVQNPVANGSTIATVTPTLPAKTPLGAGSLSYLSGPSPASANVAPGLPATFTWYYRAQTYSGLPPASYSMIATFTGTDLNNKTAVTGSDVSNSIVIAQRKLELASATIDFGNMKVGETRWVGRSRVDNTGNVSLSNVTWQASHLLKGIDRIDRNHIGFSPASNFTVSVSGNQSASFSLTIPYNQPVGTYIGTQDIFDDFLIDNNARDADEPFDSFVASVTVDPTELIDVNETVVDLGNWPQGAKTATQTISALNFGNVNLNALRLAEVDSGGISAATILRMTMPANPASLATDGLLIASISAEIAALESTGEFFATWRLYEDNNPADGLPSPGEASDTFKIRIAIGNSSFIVDPGPPNPLNMGNGTPTYTIWNVPFTVENIGTLDLTRLKLFKNDLTDGGPGVIPGENIIPEIPVLVPIAMTKAATMSIYIAAGVPTGDYTGMQTLFEDLDSDGTYIGDPDEAPFNFEMKVHVNPYRAVQVLAGTVDFGGRSPGEQGTVPFQIKNIGSVPMTKLFWEEIDLSDGSNLIDRSCYWFEPMGTYPDDPPFSLTAGELYNAVGSITIKTGPDQPPGNYVGNSAWLYDDSDEPVDGIREIDDPNDSFSVLCQVGGKSILLMNDPITITGAEPGKISASATYSVQNNGSLMLARPMASATINIPGAGFNLLPAVFSYMNSGQTKSGELSVLVPPGTLPGVYNGTLSVWNDYDNDGVLDPTEAQDTAVLQITVVSKRVLRVVPNPANIGFVPPGQTGSITISIINDGNVNIVNPVCIHKVALNAVAAGPTPIPAANITMIGDPATANLPIGATVNVDVTVAVPAGQTGYPYSSEQVIFINDDGDIPPVWDAGEPGATFTLSLTVGQKQLSVDPLVDFAVISSSGSHNRLFSVKNLTNISLSFGRWQTITPLTNGAITIPSSMFEFLPSAFTVSSGGTKSDCIASLTIVANQVPGVYTGVFKAFEDDNANSVPDVFEASDTFQVRVEVGTIPSLNIIDVSLDAGTLAPGGSTAVFNVSYQNVGNVDLNNLVWSPGALNFWPYSIPSGKIVFSPPDAGLVVGEIAVATVQIGPCDASQFAGVYSGLQHLYDADYPTMATDSFVLTCEVVGTPTVAGPDIASGSLWQEIATLTFPAPASRLILSCFVCPGTGTARIGFLETDQSNEPVNYNYVQVASTGALTTSGVHLYEGGVTDTFQAANTSFPGIEVNWYRLYLAIDYAYDAAIASHTYVVLQNASPDIGSHSVWFDGFQLEKAVFPNQARPTAYSTQPKLITPNQENTVKGDKAYFEW